MRYPALPILRPTPLHFDHVVRLGRVRSPQPVEVRFGTSRAPGRGRRRPALHHDVRRRGTPQQAGRREYFGRSFIQQPKAKHSWKIRVSAEVTHAR
ncbi:hypothetical protein ACWC9Q_34430 [Streptomyces sp. NPDC001142]